MKKLNINDIKVVQTIYSDGCDLTFKTKEDDEPCGWLENRDDEGFVTRDEAMGIAGDYTDCVTGVYGDDEADDRDASWTEDANDKLEHFGVKLGAFHYDGHGGYYELEAL